MIKVNGTPVSLGRFPDGTPLMHPPTIGHVKEVRFTWHYEGDEEMTALMFLKHHYERLYSRVLGEKRFSKTVLEMPYIPNARQDRIKSESDVFTLKSFANFINWLHFDEVYVLDPHSPVSVALIDNVVVISPREYISRAIQSIYAETNNEDLIAFFPDEGAMKRYSVQAALPYGFGIKERDWTTGRIKGLTVINNGVEISGKNIIIIDDISSRGGTFYHSAAKLKELGASHVYLYVTHCEDTIFKGDIFESGLIDKVFTTDSIFTSKAQKTAAELGLSDKIEVYELW